MTPTTTTRLEPVEPAEAKPPPSRASAPRTAGARPREYRLFLVATGLVALHVADDSFLQPQPGTSAGDHLVSGLVPLAALVLAAWAYPRLRAGVRVTIALVAGGLGIVTGIEAYYYTREVGASGDDFTGFLGMLAGLVLIGVGAVTLWRTRRTDDRRPRRYLRRLLLGLGTVAAMYVLVAPVYISYIFTHVGRAVVPPAELG